MSIRESSAEKQVESFIHRRGRNVDRSNAYRLAGKIFQKSDERQSDRREVRQSLQNVRPVGLGFATDDHFGPDESWDSKDILTRIHDRDHYIVGRTHGFSAPTV